MDHTRNRALEYRSIPTFGFNRDNLKKGDQSNMDQFYHKQKLVGGQRIEGRSNNSENVTPSLKVFENKENQGKMSNQVEKFCSKPKLRPSMFDSQKKKKLETLSEMKTKRLNEANPLHLEFSEENQWNITYSDKIIQRMFNKEQKYWVSLTDISRVQRESKFSKLRNAVVNYLTYFHLVFHIKDDHTLFKAVQIFDCYLSKTFVPRKKLQLIASACMMIAEKYEEVYPQCLDYHVKLSANTFTIKDLIKAEVTVSTALGHMYETYPSSYRFFCLFAKLLSSDEDVFYYGNFFLHLAMYDYDCLEVKPSLLAAGAIILAKNASKGLFLDGAAYTSDDIEIMFDSQKIPSDEEIKDAIVHITEILSHYVKTLEKLEKSPRLKKKNPYDKLTKKFSKINFGAKSQ
ncbi:unnamed protein product [Moneuplotes crassus]|uniref:Uncharacterized protein n=1 Tax=Euplotes crassus TaxID=5936 RepID=A0AAD1ULM3_EUPCR|nr:unnamed protein product [Moneuplotes crassus]